MGFQWWRFTEPVAVAAGRFWTNAPVAPGRYWTATFDSFDQRNDDVYYTVVITDEHGRELDRFTAKILPPDLGTDMDNWTAPEAETRMREQLQFEVLGRLGLR